MENDRQTHLIRIFGLSFLSFGMLLSYALTRPAVESLFLQVHTQKGEPMAWVLVALGITLTVSVYNRFIARIDLVHMFGASTVISGVVLAGLLLARQAGLPGSHYLLYMFKDIYVVVLVEAFYTLANAVYPIRSARWLYGLFGAIGGLGGMLGNFTSGLRADWLGTAGQLWLVPPLLLALGLACFPFARLARIGKPRIPAAGQAPLLEAVRVVRKSSYLALMVGLIGTVQVVINLVDYEFKTLVYQLYSDPNVRTGVIGNVYGFVDFGMLTLNSLAGPILRMLGVPVVLVSVPVLVGLCLGGFAVWPRFATVAVAKVAGKSLDYTLFRVAKEMLYIPLTYEEKTKGKSLVDILTYRIAKGGTGLLIRALLALQLVWLVTPLALFMIGVWLALIVVIVRRFRKTVSREQELDGAS